MKITSLIISLLTGFSLFGQTVLYNDVAVIVNDNSQTSIEIGNYFQQARNIPAQNIIHVFAPTTEGIDSLEFEQVRAQVESYLVNNNLVDSINYLVTTKGVPLKVESGCFNPTVNDKVCASFDAEIALILGSYSSSIGQYGSFPNPVYNTTDNFSRDIAGMYLVTRLDGYVKQDVFNLIDRSGPNTGLNKLSTQAVLDLNSTTNANDSSYFMNFYLQPTYDFLTTNSWTAQLDANFAPLLSQNDVFAYIYEGPGSVLNTSLNYSWTKGSISSISICETAVTFDQAQNPSNKLLIADLIAEGCTGAIGHVDCIFFSQIVNSEILLSRYLDPTVNYNLAESFYMSDKSNSWQTVVIGDPKSSVFVDNTADTDKNTIEEISIYPNPSSGIINIRSGESISSIAVFDMRGAQVKSFNEQMSNSVEIDLQELNNGVYLIQVEIGGNMIRERIVISK